MHQNKQNEISHNFLQGSDLNQREIEVLEDACSLLSFTPTALIGKSSWWGSTEIGAFHYSGTYNGKKAVLKIQGVKPEHSEIEMINSFAKNNKSKQIRPPYLYAGLPWNDRKRYEALVLEHIEGKRVVGTPASKEEIERFFELHKDYRINCRQKPWVEKPETTIATKIKRNFSNWKESSYKIFPNHPLRQPQDDALTDEAVSLLAKAYEVIEPEFQHGHFAEIDLYQAGDQVVIFSNLYWSWRAPFYDAVFGYHWYIYHLSDVPKISPPEIEQQRNYWLDEIYKISGTSAKNRKLLNLALLERATAGLTIDALSMNPAKPITPYLVEGTRKQLKALMDKLS